MLGILKSKLKWLAAGVAVLLILAGLVAWKARQPVAEFHGPVENLSMGAIKEYSLLTYIAQSQGYFQKYGVNVDIHEYDNGPAVVKDILAGKVDVGIAAEFVAVSNTFTPNDLKIITTTSKQNVFSVVGRRDHGINQPQDLKHKRIGVTRKGQGEFLLGEFLNFQGLTLDDITVVDLPAAQLLAQVQAGQLDATLTFEPNARKLAMSLGANGATFSAQPNQQVFALLLSTGRLTSTRPEAIRRYLRALYAAELYMSTHPQHVPALTGQVLGYDADYVSYMLPRFQYGLTLDQELLLAMEDEGQWAIRNHLTTQTTLPDYLKLIYFDAMQSVKPRGVTIVH